MRSMEIKALAADSCGMCAVARIIFYVQISHFQIVLHHTRRRRRHRMRVLYVFVTCSWYMFAAFITFTILMSPTLTIINVFFMHQYWMMVCGAVKHISYVTQFMHPFYHIHNSFSHSVRLFWMLFNDDFNWAYCYNFVENRM